MISCLVYFNGNESSKKGLLRGVVIFPIFLILNIIYLLITRKLHEKYTDSGDISIIKKAIFIVIAGVLIVSGLGVHNPPDSTKAIVYASLMGFVVYGIANCIMFSTNKKWNIMITFLDVLWGILSTGLLGYILYKIVSKWPKVFEY